MSRARAAPRTQPSPQEEAATGTRSVERALRLLKELSSRGEFGWRLSDLSVQVGLDRATCHRMLACFVQEGFAQRHEDDLKYYPGQLLFEMGLALPRYDQLREHVEPRLDRLVASTGCIASFCQRSGNDLVCVFQKRGTLELSGMLIRVGTRRPLTASVAGLAILQQLPEDEAARIIAENTQREFGRGGQRRIEKLERMRQRSDRQGYGFTAGELAPGICALGLPVRSPAGDPFASLLLTGSEAVLNPTNVAHFQGLLQPVVAEIEADVRKALGKVVSVSGSY